jgi:hypothetical protein
VAKLDLPEPQAGAGGDTRWRWGMTVGRSSLGGEKRECVCGGEKIRHATLSADGAWGVGLGTGD